MNLPRLRGNRPVRGDVSRSSLFFFILILLAFLLPTACNSEDGTEENGGLDGDEDRSAEETEEEDSSTFRFVVLADTHIIDEYYTGSEDSIYNTETYLREVREHINSFPETLDMILICGDVAHNYPSGDWDFLMNTRTRFDIAAELIDGFDVPVYIGFGNHDYDIRNVSRDFTHKLYKEKFGVDPYYYVDHKGFRFIHINNFLGDTWNPDSEKYDTYYGSLGADQLEWLENLLKEGKPSFLFLHYMLPLIAKDEFGDQDLLDLIKTYGNTIEFVFSGHTHTWMDLGEDFGAPNWVVASCRYDPDAYLFVEVNQETGDFYFLNEDCFGPLSADTLPYMGGEGCGRR